MRSARREFLQVVGAAGLVSLGGSVPRFWSQALAQQDGTSAGERVLVLIQLAGGNDGLNTVVPITDDAYYRARPALAIGKQAVLKLNDRWGLHPSLEGLHQLWEQGRLGIVQGVGYPRPDRSHFRSMDIWHTANPDVVQPQTGWIGRTLDAAQGTEGREAVAVGLDRLPLALVGHRVVCPLVKSLEAFRLNEPAGGSPLRTADWQRAVQAPAPPRGELEFLRRSAQASLASADRLKSLGETYRTRVEYPSTGLAQRLKLVAQMIVAELPARVYFVSLDGFDTHAQQLPGHAALLAELAGAVASFVADLEEHRLTGRVLIATFSEFGRRLAENGSLGTDHGAAAPLFVVTPHRGGLFGEAPSLTDLDDGDPKFTTDFRRVYATLLENWLNVDSSAALGGRFEPLDCV
uniref:DUF1501 domain-containing protein n=1 Tax=Schlesneria paludicola TaxID=360056 RepID=A0A7C4QW94_9PLAN